MARRRFRIHLGRADPPPLLAPDIDDVLTEGERARRLLLQIAGQWIVIFMISAALLYWAVSTLVGLGIFVPKTAQAVLSSAHQPRYYAWSSEDVREVTLAGVSMRQDAYRSAVIDLNLNKFQALAIGVLPSPTIWLSDGTLTAYLNQTNAQSSQSWRLVTDFCHGAPTVPASSLEMPTPQEIEKAHPKLISANASVFGTQAWVMSFKPTPKILEQAFWLSFFDYVTAPAPQYRRWVLSSSELQAIESGKIKLIYAYAWVSRSPRELRQIEMKFYTSSSETSGYRFLIKLYPAEGEPLKKTTFGSTDCNGQTTVPSGQTTVPTVPGG